MSSTPLPAVDVSTHVHNALDGFYKPTRQELTCIDEVGFDYVETTEDTSPRHVPSFQPVVDASNCVHNTFNGSQQPTRRKLTPLDDNGFDYIETTRDTSPRRVPSFLPAVDVSKHVHNTFDGFHKPTRRESTCLNEICVDYDENTKATSVRRVPTVLHHPSTFQPVVDASNCVYNSLNTSLHRKPSYFDEIGFDYIENSKDTSVRRVPPSSRASQHLDALLVSLDAATDEDGGD
jgi:hypothetical protein